MNEAATSHPESYEPKPSRRATPFWLDAFIATGLAHLAFAVHLRFTGWSSMAAEWLQLPRELWWWGVFFFPGFLILLFVAFRSRPHHVAPLAIGAFLLYIAIAALTPRISQ
jgi:hypothetical protein